MNWAYRRVGDVAEQIRGVTYDKSEASSSEMPGYRPILRAGNITDDGLLLEDLVYVPKRRISERQMVRVNDVLIAASSGSLSVVGKAARATTNVGAAFGAFCKVLRPRPEVDPGFFAHFFRTFEYRRRISKLAAGININNLRGEHLDGLLIPFPPLGEQRRIAEVLDRADELLRQRGAALRTLDALNQAVFRAMFGDPATNPRGWPKGVLTDLAAHLSDGPFGSNLKTSHYTTSGVRVVRLQNIGVGEFIDTDRAYISDAHFSTLAKHECRAGDVLIGTLGDPNLRACLQPDWLPKALNKADCVVLRPDPSIADPFYVCALLNQPSTEQMAQALMLGQTRLRISMGRLRTLRVPIPPIRLQKEFARRVAAIDRLKAAHRASLAQLDALFASLQHRAFRGEL